MTLAQFSDPKTGEVEAYLGAASEIWVPQKVAIGSSPYPENPSSECVLYETPKIWSRPPFPDFSRGLFLPLRDVGWQRKSGTDALRDFKGLLADFVRLSDTSADEVKRFVLKWGPIWWCTDHRDCCYQMTILLKPGPEDAEHHWVPAEAVEDFKAKAQQVKAVLDIAARLFLDKPKPGAVEDWKILGWDEAEEGEVWMERFYLAATINRYVSMWEGSGLWLYWERKDKKPRLTINTGLGFFPVVWLQVAQVLSGAKGPCICDGCQRVYIRFRRRPPKGRNNYCETCYKKDRGAKRRFAQKKSRLKP